MATTPLLCATPGAPVTYNPSMAETFSWVPVEGAGRPLYAQASYLVGGADINIDVASIEANTDELEAKLDLTNSLLSAQLGQSGFVFLTGGASAITGSFSTFQVVSACKIASITATNSSTNGLTEYELPVNFSFSGPITEISLTYGAALVYKL